MSFRHQRTEPDHRLRFPGFMFKTRAFRSGLFFVLRLRPQADKAAIGQLSTTQGLRRCSGNDGGRLVVFADSGRRRTGFRGDREKRSGVKTNGIPG